MQILQKEKGRVLDTDQTYIDPGSPPIFAMVGGQRVQIQAGTPAKPTLQRKGTAFFTDNGVAIDEQCAAPWLEDPQQPEDFKQQLRKFLAQYPGGKGLKVKATEIRKQPKKRRNWHVAGDKQAAQNLAETVKDAKVVPAS